MTIITRAMHFAKKISSLHSFSIKKDSV